MSLLVPSAPSLVSTGIRPPPPPPSLPLGWTEHTAPTGHLYYYHAATNQSTYVRPLPVVGQAAATAAELEPSASTKKKKAKQERPIAKSLIPGTEWSRVKTSEGNTFYFHKGKRESVWEAPEEILEALAEFEMEEEERAQSKKSPMPPPAAFGLGRLLAAEGKINPGMRAPTTAETQERKVKEEDEKGVSSVAPEVEMADGETGADDEEWQRQVAEEMAAEDEAAKEEATKDPTGKKEKSPAKEATPPPSLSPEEARALFKTLLQEKDINPLTPYDAALPQLINDPRYVLLPNIADRHAVFNEYCLEKTRALRAAKAAASASAGKETGSPVDEKLKARKAYEGLLRDELKSTRTTWDEWRKKWKKDRRFFGFGRDDREREKVFKEWRSALGERKRKEAQKAEADFFALLRENEKLVTESTSGGKGEISWKDVKKHKALYSEPRYDAVGSSSLREELFATYLKARMNPNNQPRAPPTTEASSSKDVPEDPEAKRKRERQERQEKALRERGQQARKEMAKVEKDINRSMGQLSEKESVDDFMTLLTDAIRDPTATYDEAIATLSRSPAFTRSRLSAPQKISLFNAHVRKLRDKQLTALFAVFEGYTPGLDARFEDLPESVYGTSPAVRLGLGQSKAEQSEETKSKKFDERRARDEMRRLWEDWQAERNVKAREDFQKLLEENHFVGFWAGVTKLGKEGGSSSSGGGMGNVAIGVEDLEGEDPGENDDDNGVGKADLKTLAKGIGGKQIEDVLKHDKRYRVFDHIPEERAGWIKEFVSKMSAPKLSVHAPDK